MVATRDRGPLTFDLDVDVCVVGGGMAGLTVAYEVARRGWSVAVLEGRRIAWNASGRNSGFVLPGFSQSNEAIVERVGLDHTKELWALSEGGVEYVRAAIAENEMPGVNPVDGWLHVSKTDNGDALLTELTLLGQELGADVEGWPVERVRAMLRSRHYFHAIHYPRAFHMHPLNYALGLAAAAERAGARIFEQTPVLSVDPAGIRKRIRTRHARVRAEHVVLAGNVHLGNVDRRLSGTLSPAWTYQIVTEPLGERLADSITYHGAVSDTDLADNHYRIVDGDRLMWSGRSTVWQANPRQFMRALVRDIRAVYPRQRGVKVANVWSGVLGITVHRMPQIGALSPGLWVASGFVGHGMNTTAMAGQMIANAIIDGDDRWRLFVPFELIWAGGVAGRVFHQFGYWNHFINERLSARAARRRDRRERRESPRPAAELPASQQEPAVAAATETAVKANGKSQPRRARVKKQASGPAQQQATGGGKRRTANGSADAKPRADQPSVRARRRAPAANPARTTESERPPDPVEGDSIQPNAMPTQQDEAARRVTRTT